MAPGIRAGRFFFESAMRRRAARFSILAGLAILATASNLTNEPFVTFQNGDERQIRDHQNYGRNYMLGLSYKF